MVYNTVRSAGTSYPEAHCHDATETHSESVGRGVFQPGIAQLALGVEVVVCVKLCDDVEVLSKAGHKFFDLLDNLVLSVLRLSSKCL